MKTQLQLHNQDVTVATTSSLTKRSGPAGRQKISSKGDSKVGGGGRGPPRDWNRMPGMSSCHWLARPCSWSVSVNLGAMRRFNGPAKNFVRDALSESTSRPWNPLSLLFTPRDSRTPMTSWKVMHIISNQIPIDMFGYLRIHSETRLNGEQTKLGYITIEVSADTLSFLPIVLLLAGPHKSEVCWEGM